MSGRRHCPGPQVVHECAGIQVVGYLERTGSTRGCYTVLTPGTVWGNQEKASGALARLVITGTAHIQRRVYWAVADRLP